MFYLPVFILMLVLKFGNYTIRTNNLYCISPDLKDYIYKTFEDRRVFFIAHFSQNFTRYSNGFLTRF